jgi:hypothetical protein
MAGIRIEGNTSGNVAEVNSAHELLVALSANEATAGYATVTSEVDAGTVTGTRLMRDLEVSADYRLRVALDTPFFTGNFPGTAIDTTLWSQVVGTMAVAVQSGFLTLNSGLSTASGGYAVVRTYRNFPLLNTATLYFEMCGQLTQLPVANNVSEWGLAFAATSVAPTDGCVFRLNASGEFRCVNIANSVELQSDPLNFSTLVGNNVTRHFIVGISDDQCEYWINDVLVAVINRGNAGYGVTASLELPIMMRTYNTAVTASVQVLKVGMVGVTLSDIVSQKLWSHVMVGQGGTLTQGQNPAAPGTTALYTNSLAAGTGAAATNTSAALGSGLGGQFSLQPTLAVPTDGVISSYGISAGTVAIPGKTYYLTYIKISGVVTTVLAGGPVVLAWSLAYGHTSVTLAATEGAGTKAPRRVPLGIQVWPVTAALWTQADRDIAIQFDPPIPVQPGEFIQTVAKNIGVVTTSGVITFLITANGYCE